MTSHKYLSKVDYIVWLFVSKPKLYVSTKYEVKLFYFNLKVRYKYCMLIFDLILSNHLNLNLVTFALLSSEKMLRDFQPNQRM